MGEHTQSRIILSLLLTICLALFTVAGAETPVVGGWALALPTEPAQLDADLAAAFAEAAGDSGLIPVAVIAQQVVAGANTLLLCAGDDGYHMVVLYQDLQGSAELTQDNPFPLEDYANTDADAPSEVLDGGLFVPETLTALPLPEDAQAALDEALEAFVGSDIVPVALLGTQVVAGTNYAILCRVTPMVPNAVPTMQVVTVYADPQGNAELVSFCAINPAAFNP